MTAQIPAAHVPPMKFERLAPASASVHMKEIHRV
jgi:hypothetical protein